MSALVEDRRSTIALPAPGETLLDVEGLRTWFPVGGGLFGGKGQHVRAVEDVSFSLKRGEVVGLVGESGSGKTTVGRSVLRLTEPTAGSVRFAGTDILGLSKSAFQAYRREMQIVFQDPYASLNPRMTVGEIVGEALTIHGLSRGRQRPERIADLLRRVGLRPDAITRYPHEFSGGQRQRIGIARAISLDPAFIVADEPVSALDVSIQAQIVNLLQDLQERKNLSYLFIAHDLAVVRHIADRVAVMYLGRIVETGPKAAVYGAPHHPYTQALLSAAPEPDPDRPQKRIILQGDVPSPSAVPSGCSFRTRCPLAQEICARERPPLASVGSGHLAACHFAKANPIPI